MENKFGHNPDGVTKAFFDRHPFRVPPQKSFRTGIRTHHPMLAKEMSI